MEGLQICKEKELDQAEHASGSSVTDAAILGFYFIPWGCEGFRGHMPIPSSAWAQVVAKLGFRKPSWSWQLSLEMLFLLGSKGHQTEYQWGCKSVLCVLKPTTKPFWAPRASPPGFFIRRKMETVCFENHETLLQGFGPLHFFLTIWETVFLLAVGVQKGHVMGVIPPYPLQPTPSLLKHVWEKSVLIWILRIKTASKQNQEPGGPLSENSTPASNLGDTSF